MAAKAIAAGTIFVPPMSDTRLQPSQARVHVAECGVKCKKEGTYDVPPEAAVPQMESNEMMGARTGTRRVSHVTLSS